MENTFIGKTKILRVRGGEVYFKKLQHDSGTTWELMFKDLSAVTPRQRDTKFKSLGCYRQPKPFDEPIRPVPSNFESDLLSPFGAVEYAPGHEPLKPLKLR